MNRKLRGSSAISHFACVYSVVAAKILFMQIKSGNFDYAKILNLPGIERVTLSILLEIHVSTATNIWALISQK